MKMNAITAKINKVLGLAGLLLAAALPVSQAHANMVTNGSFENGTAGFTSAYGYRGLNSGTGEAQYSIFTRATQGISSQDGSNMFLGNGAMDQRNVWTQAGITVLAHTDYVFSAWVSTLHDNDPVVFEFSINGNSVGLHSTGSAVGWTQFQTVWNSGNTTSAMLSIVDTSTAFSGNDFVLDNIAFDKAQASAVPEPASLALVAMGLSGALFTGRRRRQAGR